MTQTSSRQRPEIPTRERSTARTAGILYFVTHVTSVAAAVLYGGSGFDPHAPLAGRDSVLLGGILEVLLAVSVVGTAVALYPLIRRRSAAVATGYLGLRTLEASVILVGIVTLLPVVARPGTLDNPALPGAVSDALRLVHDWTFLVGPGLIVPFHTVLLAVLLWRERLVPRFIPLLGIVGGPLVGLMNLAVLLGLTKVIPVLVVPVFAWEVTLAAYLIVRGLPATHDRGRVAS